MVNLKPVVGNRTREVDDTQIQAGGMSYRWRKSFFPDLSG